MWPPITNTYVGTIKRTFGSLCTPWMEKSEINGSIRDPQELWSWFRHNDLTVRVIIIRESATARATRSRIVDSRNRKAHRWIDNVKCQRYDVVRFRLLIFYSFLFSYCSFHFLLCNASSIPWSELILLEYISEERCKTKGIKIQSRAEEHHERYEEHLAIKLV